MTSKTPKSEYAPRDASELEPFYSRHVNAMTAEGLHSKSAIAAELAYRDKALTDTQTALQDSLRIQEALAENVQKGLCRRNELQSSIENLEAKLARAVEYMELAVAAMSQDSYVFAYNKLTDGLASPEEGKGGDK